MERIFPEALVLHFKHPKPQNSSLEHNPLWPKTPDQFKLCLSKKCKMCWCPSTTTAMNTPCYQITSIPWSDIWCSRAALHPVHSCIPCSSTAGNEHSASAWTPKGHLHRPNKPLCCLWGSFSHKTGILPLLSDLILKGNYRTCPREVHMGTRFPNSVQNRGLSRDAGLRVHYNLPHAAEELLLLSYLPLSKSRHCKVIVSSFCLANKCHFLPSLTSSVSSVF